VPQVRLIEAWRRSWSRCRKIAGFGLSRNYFVCRRHVTNLVTDLVPQGGHSSAGGSLDFWSSNVVSARDA
jgi:hypothetical protein